MNKALSDHELRLKRLKFRSWHRGWKEMDLILGHFADARLPSLTEAELATYEQLLEEDDDILWGWLTGKAPTPAHFAATMAMLEGYGRS